MTLPTSGKHHHQRGHGSGCYESIPYTIWWDRQDMSGVAMPPLHVFRAQIVYWVMGASNSWMTMTGGHMPEPVPLNADPLGSVGHRPLLGMDVAGQPLGQTSSLSDAAPTEPVPPWAPHGKVKSPLQAQIIRLLSYAPVFNYGNGEFHDWHMVHGMLSEDLQRLLPSNMEDFFHALQVNYPDFAFKMDGSAPAKVAFTRQQPLAPKARNYVTERVMTFCRAHGVRQATMKDMINFADPTGVYNHQPAHFIEYIKTDPARCTLVNHSDPWQVTVVVHEHVILEAGRTRKQRWKDSQEDSELRKRHRGSLPGKTLEHDPCTAPRAPRQQVIQVQDDPPCAGMVPAREVNGNQLPMPKLMATQVTMQ